jgi:hypothetical protein
MNCKKESNTELCATSISQQLQQESGTEMDNSKRSKKSIKAITVKKKGYSYIYGNG